MEEEYHLLLGEGFVDGIDEIFAARDVDAGAVAGTPDSETPGGTDEVSVSAGAVEVNATKAADGGSMMSAESSDFGGAGSSPEACGAFGKVAKVRVV